LPSVISVMESARPDILSTQNVETIPIETMSADAMMIDTFLDIPSALNIFPPVLIKLSLAVPPSVVCFFLPGSGDHPEPG
jgi:hypothetical protein